jgi:AcrR family transcriptional regulator
VTEGKRVYRSELRAEQARRTRVQVLEAATRCFTTRGYAATTMREIAAAAGVSVPTVFAQGSKAALLLACVDRSLVGTDDDRPVRELGAFEELLTAPDRAGKLAAQRRLAAEVSPAHVAMQAVFADAAAVDPEVGAAYTEYEGRRRADTTVLVEAFGPWLRDDVETAVDVCWAVLSPQTMVRLLRDCGWPVERYADWLVGAVERLLLR